MDAIEKIDTGLYRVALSEHCTVEIGAVATRAIGFYPNVKIKKWGDECCLTLIPRGEWDINDPIETKDGDLISKIEALSDDGTGMHCYPCEKDEGSEQGLIELEAVIHEKPKDGEPYRYTWDYEDSGNISIVYNPGYSLEQFPEDVAAGVVEFDKTGGWNIDGRKIAHVKPWAVDSWELWRTGTKVYHSKSDGKKYRTGKIGHFRRAKIIDSIGQWEYATTHIDTVLKTITVTGTAEFAKIAVGEVYIDPTFGYTTTPSGSVGLNDTIAGHIGGPGEVGTVTLITVYLGDYWSSGDRVKCALYDTSGNLQSPQSVERSDGPAAEAWFDFTVANISVTDQNYWIMAWGDDNYCDIGRDSGGGTNSEFANGQTYGSWPDPLSTSPSGSHYATYATYTVAGTGWPHKINGIANANIGKVNGVPIASIGKINGIS